MQEVVLQPVTEAPPPARTGRRAVPAPNRGQPLLLAEPHPQPPHRDGGGEGGQEPGAHHGRISREGDGGGDEDDRVDGGRGQQEGERGGRRDPAPHQAVRHGHGRALAARQHGPGRSGDGHGERRVPRQYAPEDPLRHERPDRRRHDRAQQQEGDALYGDGGEHGPPGGHGGGGEIEHDHRPEHRPDGNDGEQRHPADHRVHERPGHHPRPVGCVPSVLHTREQANGRPCARPAQDLGKPCQRARAGSGARGTARRALTGRQPKPGPGADAGLSEALRWPHSPARRKQPRPHRTPR